ncbi:MAG: hypothetical protein AUI11_09900 [Acidobacteria bacterium 13_2_20CM_2_66_4]|nr:MAG: hypothetical protein AUI11_09900 [Acidobacteria bacterium 13_2_20CM_2_66_4]
MKGFGGCLVGRGDQNWHRPDKRGIAAEQSVYSRRGRIHGTRRWFRVGFRRLCAAAAAAAPRRRFPVHANSSAILSLNTTYGTSWLSPTQILQGRLVKVGAQIDF